MGSGKTQAGAGINTSGTMGRRISKRCKLDAGTGKVPQEIL